MRYRTFGLVGKLPFILLGAVTICLMTATVVEKIEGSQIAFSDIYLSHWMIALWTLTAATALVEVLIRCRVMGFGPVLLHASLVLILIGAALTHFGGEQGRVCLTVGDPPLSEWTLTDGNSERLPFSVRLVDCGVDYYTSAVAARDYYSVLDIDGRQYRVSMNKVIDYRGYCFTQTALGEKSSTLSISHDPLGRDVSFTAYGLLFLSMTLILMKSSRFHTLMRKAMLPVLLLTIPLQLFSQPKVLQRPLAKTYGELLVMTGGRICPAQTLAKDFCYKVYGKAGYKGLTSEQVLTGWIYYYDEWKHEPMIRLKSKEARRLLGREYVALTDLFTRDGYLLEPLLKDSGVSVELIADDEKITLISSVVTGKVPELVNCDSFEMVRLREEVAAEIASGHFKSANNSLRELRIRQCQFGGDAIPSQFVLRTEVLYNKIFCPLWAAILAFVGGVAGIVGWRRIATVFCLLVTLYLTLIITQRWIIGGHIPLATGFETMIVLAWSGGVFALIAVRKLPVILPTGLLVSGAALVVAMIGSHNPAVSPLIPVLASRMLSLHVMLVMSSYTLFAIIALNSLGVLVGRGSADVSRFLLYPAVFLLAAGIFVGAIWADHSWGRYWGWDPKETWALITLFVYALPLHEGTFSMFRSDKVLSIYLLLSFLSVLMTYFGVNYLLSGLHSYGAG